MRDPEAIVRELTDGQGYVVLERLYDAETVAAAKARLQELGAAQEARNAAPDDVAYGSVIGVRCRASI